MESTENLESEAREAEESGNLELAVSIWKRIAESSNNGVHFLQYGRIAQKLGRWQESEVAYSRALEIKPNSSVLLECMGSLWAHRDDKDELESFEEAQVWFLRACEIKKSPHLLTQLGAVQVALEDDDAAAKSFEEALRLDDCYEEAMYNLAVLHTETQPNDAVRLLERAIEIDPAYGLAHQKLGVLIQKRGDLANAEYHFRRCLEINPKDYWSMLYLANALSAQGKLAESGEEYARAVALDPTIEAGPLFYAKLLGFMGKHEKAVEMRDLAPKRPRH
jgi:tetratricopeptide (TPR) repeat protein